MLSDLEDDAKTNKQACKLVACAAVALFEEKVTSVVRHL